MKKYLILAISFLFFVPALSAQTKKFDVGVLVPLSGPVAEYGVAIKNGIQMATSKNPNHFLNCNFIFEDTEYKSSTTISAFKKVVEVNQVSLVYVFGGPMGEVLAPIAESKKLPLLTDTIDPKVSIGRKYVSRPVNSNFEYAEKLTIYLLSLGIKKVSIVNTNNQYLDSLIDGFKEAAKDKIEIEILASISPTDIDLKFLMPKVKKINSAAIGLFLLPGQLSTFGKFFASNLEKVKIFGGDFLDSESEVLASNGVLEGAIFANNVLDEEFRKQYFAIFKNQAQLKFAAEGFDVANLIADKFCNESRKLVSEEILNKLYNEMEIRKGAQGEIKFNKSDRGDKYWSGPVGVYKASKNGSILVN